MSYHYVQRPRRLLLFVIAFLVLLAVCMSPVLAAGQASVQRETPTTYHCTFAKDGWNESDWQFIENPFSVATEKWVQATDHIENRIPEGLTLEEALKSRYNSLYISMVLQKQVSGPSVVSSVMSFKPRMAPLIVISGDLDRSKPGVAQYGQYLEVVIYDKGINIWFNKHENGKTINQKLAWSYFDLKPDTKYELTVKIDGKNVEASVDGHSIGCKWAELPESYHAGITACEGLNRFYDFTVKPVK